MNHGDNKRATSDRRWGLRRIRCAFMGFLLPTFFVGQIMVNTAFFDTASSFRCQLNTITPRKTRIISQPKAHSITSLLSVSQTHATVSINNASPITPLASIIPEGIPMQEHGTPVGAVILPRPCIESFYSLCQEALPEIKNLKFRGVENYEDELGAMITKGSAEVTYKTIHIQTEVAASLLGGYAPSLVEFIHQNSGHFIPGARMQRDKGRGKKPPNRLNPSSSSNKQSPRFTFVELFAGVGGFRLGLEPLGGSCVLASEKDEVACAFYKRHFGKNQR